MTLTTPSWEASEGALADDHATGLADDHATGLSGCQACRATVLLAGMTRQQFHELAASLEPVWQERRREALDRPGRLTPIGGGRKFSLPFGSRLLLALLHLRWEVTYRALSALFHVGTQTVERACRDLRPLLASAPVRCVRVPNHRGSQLLLAQLEQVAVTDGRALLEAIGSGPCTLCDPATTHGAAAS